MNVYNIYAAMILNHIRIVLIGSDNDMEWRLKERMAMEWRPDGARVEDSVCTDNGMGMEDATGVWRCCDYLLFAC